MTAKPMDATRSLRAKAQIESYVAEGRTIDLVRIEPRRDADGRPREKNRYEVRIDGDAVGQAFLPNGFGRQHYRATALWDRFDPALGEPELSKFLDFGQRMYDRAAVAARFVAWADAGAALTADQIAAKLEAYAERRRRAEEERRLEREERARVREEEERRAEADRLSAVEGLTSIRDRLRPSLSNLEIDALERAIAHYRADGGE